LVRAKLPDVSDREHFQELATGYLISIAILPKVERIEIPEKISWRRGGLDAAIKPRRSYQ
jgi:hypothetical protein